VAEYLSQLVGADCSNKAPELMSEDGERSRETDVYALGMVGSFTICLNAADIWVTIDNAGECSSNYFP
jgi:hypothetical protein